MLLWFVGPAVVVVWAVFSSAAVDHRLVILGALLPLLELALGRPWLLHSLLGAVAGLALVMLIAPRRRLVQRRLVAVPIGLFLHLALDGAWADSEAFWWPLLGSGGPEARFAELSWPWVLAKELLGLLVIAWCWRRFGLGDPGRRRRFLSHGRLDPAPAP